MRPFPQWKMEMYGQEMSVHFFFINCRLSASYIKHNRDYFQEKICKLRRQQAQKKARTTRIFRNPHHPRRENWKRKNLLRHYMPISFSISSYSGPICKL